MLTVIHEEYTLGRVHAFGKSDWNDEKKAAAEHSKTVLNDEINKEAISSLLSKHHIR